MQLFLFFNWRKYFVDFNFRSWYKINMDRSDDKMPTTMFYYRKWYHDIKTTLSKSGWTILASYCSVQNHVDRTARCVYINAREYRRVNQKWTIQRNRQHRVHKTKTNKLNKNTTQYMLDTTMRKQTYFDLHNDGIWMILRLIDIHKL